MSTAVAPTAPPEPTAPASPAPRFYRLSVEQYDRMARLGILTKHDRVELIDGLLVEKMTKNERHHTTVWRINRAFVRVLPEGWFSVTEWPVRLAESEPEPDLLVLRGTIEDYDRRKPGAGDVGLLIEVSDTSLAEDRTRAAYFAGAAVGIYWIANIPDRRIEVYSDPAGTEYRSRADFGLDAEVPLVLDGQAVARIPVRDLLPSPEQG